MMNINITLLPLSFYLEAKEFPLLSCCQTSFRIQDCISGSSSAYGMLFINHNYELSNLFVLLCCSYAGSNYLAKEVNHNRIVPTSPLCSSKDGAAEVPVVDNIMHGTNQVSCKEDDTHQSSPRKRKMSRRQRRRGLCCFSINSGQIDS